MISTVGDKLDCDTYRYHADQDLFPIHALLLLIFPILDQGV
jgi:hypothetical protein